jgi:AraC-like DNA-binding protein
MELYMTVNLPAPASPAEKPAQPKRITKKIRAAVDALVHGDAKSITEAAEQAGLSRSHLSRELGKPHISAFLRDKVARNLHLNSAKAGATKVQLLDSANEMVRHRASSFILGLAGIRPEAAPAVNINLEIKAGYVIGLSDDPPPSARETRLVIDVTPNADVPPSLKDLLGA